ncbi:MAG: transcription antitermination factor NusB [Candidatus Curtissbacteria bacterium]|nr:transcription antitermination factor NusB [Candidatus Curtissbacteria bacterium]
MKRKGDPRHKVRVETVKDLFAQSFRPDSESSGLTEQVLLNKGKTDALIKKNAPAWPLAQIPPLDLAILRLAVYELVFKEKKEPYKVVIDEAVEIAKEYGNESSASFVNGVLGSIVKSNIKMQKSK